MRSLPTRERGLKFDDTPENRLTNALSLPTRERGLKFLLMMVYLLALMSLPTRERGLKFRLCQKYIILLKVAPYAGAWIEIEDEEAGELNSCASLPTRERGLKYYKRSFLYTLKSKGN